jgi:glycosyltransferase involved in cell wall biosynthesis
MVKVSVLINTLNEEKNIKNCLETVKWADEIIIVDMYSDDKTVEIARDYTNRIFMHKRMGYADPARKYALEQASHEWILVIDADELVPLSLKEQLIKIAESNEFDAVLIPHQNYFFGRQMKGAGWGSLQDKHIRFYKKSFMRYTDRVHDFAQLDPKARIYEIHKEDCGFIHFNYIDVEHFFDKFNRYTTIEADNAFQVHEKFSVKRAIYRTVKEFLVRYIKRKGYKDGFQGFALSFFMASYRLSSALKLYIKEKYPDGAVREDILKDYNRIALEESNKYTKKQERDV